MDKTVEENLVKVAENVPKVHESGYKVGFEEGKQAEYNAFWDNAKKTMDADIQWFYNFSGSAWNDFTFNPPFDLVVLYTSGLFYQSAITDLKGILDRNRVKLDFSKATRINSITEASSITRIGVIDTRKCPALQNFLYNSVELEYVEKIILMDGSKTQISGNLSFNFCAKLKHCLFEGVMGFSSWNFSYCPLSVESMKSIISCLKDYSGTTDEFKFSVLFSDTCWAALEADSTSPNGGTWEAYVESLGWLT